MTEYRWQPVPPGASRALAIKDGESYISMDDFAVAFVDELEEADAVHTQLGVGH